MSELGSLSSAFRVESVEWSRRPNGTTLHVRGRWRRRGPVGAGQPILVLARADRRRRVPAIPEPPGVGGAEPGTWQMSFAVPSEASPVAGDRAWLQIGAVMIPLPLDEETTAEVTPPRPAAPVGGLPPPPPALLAERRLHAAELSLEAAHARAAAAENARRELEAELERLGDELTKARNALAERDRARRLAEQREYAERTERVELQAKVTALTSGREPSDAIDQAAAERIDGLEAERDVLERRLVEAEQLRRAAQSARRRAESELAHRLQSSAVAVSETVLADEASLARARPEPGSGGPSRPRPTGLETVRDLARERRMIVARVAGRSSPVDGDGRLREVLDAIGSELAVLRAALAREQGARQAAETRAASAERELAGSHERAAQAYAALGALRMELSVGREPADQAFRPASSINPPAPARAPAAAPAPAPTAAAAAAGAAAPAPAPTAAAAAAGAAAPAPAPLPGGDTATGEAPAFDPSRLDAARSRLRTVPAQAEPAASPDWLARVLRSLAAADPAAAGRLTLALLPAHTLIATGSVRYDLVLEEGGVLCIDVAGDRTPVTVRAADAARSASEVDFAFRGSLAALGRRVASGSTRRDWGRDRGRVVGDRVAARALAALGRAPVRLRTLLAAGVALDGWLALNLAAHAIGPRLAGEERVTIVFVDPAASGSSLLLHVGGGRPPLVAQAPVSVPAATEVEVSGPDLAPLLAGVSGVGAKLRGDLRGLERIQRWLELAQSG